MLAVSIFLVFFLTDNKDLEKIEQSTVILGGEEFVVKVSDNFLTRERGLSGSLPLLDNEGMIFVFDKSDKHSFWMKDMSYSIDIIWIDMDMRIVHIEKSLSPDTYPKSFSPKTPSLYVLEVLSGTSDRLGIKIGDTVQFFKK